jgi:hypothetical protein
MNWRVNLIGNKDDLEDLSSIFSSSDPRIIWNGDGYLLESSLFTYCLDDKSIKEETDKLLAAINAIKVLKLQSSKPITRGAIFADNINGNRTIFLETTLTAVAIARIDMIAFNPDGTRFNGNPDNHEINWVSLYSTNNRVQRVFEIITHNYSSFIELYKIIEIIEEDNFAPVMRGGEYYKVIKLFNQTAESYNAVGKDARHSHERFKPPADPMTLDQAKDLITKILYLWLKSRESN